jgi:acid phosphatase type 7
VSTMLASHAARTVAALSAILAVALATAAPAAHAGARRLAVPESVSPSQLSRPGLAIRVSVGRRDRVLRVRLRRLASGRLVRARYFRVRAGRRQTVRLHVRAATAARLRAGRYVVSVKAGRRKGRLNGRTRRDVVRLVVAAGPPVPAPPPPPPPPGPPPPQSDPVVAAAGDIACMGVCGQDETAALITDVIRPRAVLGLGDFQYDTGTLANFRAYYDPYWGRFKSITYPINGGGEDFFGTGDYIAYFNDGGPVRLQPEGSYSFNLGSWHIVALNSHCFPSTTCDEDHWTDWLRRDLAANPTGCTLAYWHLPYWTSPTADDGHPSLKAWVDVLYAAGADVLLQASNHLYERFAPQNPAGGRDSARGIVAFTVGTGGRSHVVPFSVAPNSVVLNADTFGVLALTLRPTGYDFRFVPEPGKTFTDAGSASCH